ncbi:hypothetical protein NX059_012197 [Plenodomus lindquistii]|nr:hypothetical protein NX059_012197 [Plenodomus lindquistii]
MDEPTDTDLDFEDEDYEDGSYDDNDDDDDRLQNGLDDAVGLKLGECLVYKDRDTIVGAQKLFFWITLDQLKANQRIPFDRWGLAPEFSLYLYQVVFLYMVILRNQGKVKGGILANPMGAGKTVMCLVWYMLTYHLHQNRLQVLEHWGVHHDERFDGVLEHSEKGHKDPNVSCPSRDKLAVPCYKALILTSASSSRNRRSTHSPQRWMPEFVSGAGLVEQDMSVTTQDGKVRSIQWEIQHCGPPTVPRQRKQELSCYGSARIGLE